MVHKLKRILNKLLIAAATFGLLALLSIDIVYAADKTVTCGVSECTGLSGPLFYETNILPGDKFVKTVSIVNSRTKDIQVKIYASKQSITDDVFLDVIFMSVIRNGSMISNTSLRDFLDGRKINIGTIGPGLSTEVKFEALFSPDAGNLYQRKTAVFDIYLNIEGDDFFPTPTPTAVSTSTPLPTTTPSFPPFPTFPPIPSILGCTSGFPCIPPIAKIIKPPRVSSILGSSIIDCLRKIFMR